MENKEKLQSMMGKNNTQAEAFELYDSLESIDTEEMWGLWKGEELSTGHPFEGLLTASKWYGKKFVSKEEVYPLLFERKDGSLYAGNPGLIPMTLPFDKIPSRLVSRVIPLIRPVFKTKNSGARLRMVDFRGKASASMVYDQKGIIDIFRKVDDNTLMGIMDIKEMATDKSYFFILRRANY